MKIDPRERSLRKTARLNGFGIARRYVRSASQFGYMLYDMRSSTIVAGADPAPYSLSLDEVEQFLKDDRDSHGAAGKRFVQNCSSTMRL